MMAQPPATLMPEPVAFDGAVSDESVLETALPPLFACETDSAFAPPWVETPAAVEIAVEFTV